MTSNKMRRLCRVVSPSTPTFMLPIDDALISGPSGALDDPRVLVGEVKAAGLTSVLAYPGTIDHCGQELLGIGIVQNLSASTTLQTHTRKVVIGTAMGALISGADCVAVQVNYSSLYEPEMLRAAGTIAEECRRYELPLLVISYPRVEGIGGQDNNYEHLRASDPEGFTRLVAHCARASVELGADIVKVPYTGSVETMARVVKAAMGRSVLIAGGPPGLDADAIEMAIASVKAGAAGVSFGRLTFQRRASDSATFVEEVVNAMMSVR